MIALKAVGAIGEDERRDREDSAGIERTQQGDERKKEKEGDKERTGAKWRRRTVERKRGRE